MFERFNKKMGEVKERYKDDLNDSVCIGALAGTAFVLAVAATPFVWPAYIATVAGVSVVATVREVEEKKEKEKVETNTKTNEVSNEKKAEVEALRGKLLAPKAKKAIAQELSI